MPPQAKKHRILIVEDEISLRHALRDAFSREGFLVLEAKDGEQGFATAMEHEPDIILLDIVMPKMDGMTMVMGIRTSGPWGKQVPIILLTNLGLDDHKTMKIIDSDTALRYLVKSNWKIHEVVSKVRQALP